MRRSNVPGKRPAPGYRLKSGVRVMDLTCAEIEGIVAAKLARGESAHICTVNPEIAELCGALRRYRQAVNAADIRTVDGVGVTLAVLRQHRRVVRRLTGMMVAELLVDWARRHRRPLAIVGARPRSRQRCEEVLRSWGVEVWPGVSPRVTDDGTAYPAIDDCLPDGGVVLVALTAPKQELLIRKQVAGSGKRNVYAGVGGVVDYLSGESRLPPAAIRRAGLEWLYRLLRQPEERWERQRHSLPRFFWREVVWG